MRRTIMISILISGAVLAMVSLFPQAAQAQWQATAGAQNHDKGRQAMAFLPNEFWIHQGDSITWKFDSDAVHTVTFLIAGQVRPAPTAVCPLKPETTPDFDVESDECVNSGRMTNGQSYIVTFPNIGNFKLLCLVHPSMNGVVHVLDPSQPLPHNQDFYDDQAAAERRDLLSDRDGDGDGDHDPADLGSHHSHSRGNVVTSGIGEIVATPGGPQTLSVMRFLEPTKVIHVGETVEWSNSDPVEPHTITFGIEPANPMPASPNVSVDADGARHAVIASTADSVHSGFIVASLHERTGVAQAPLGFTRFRVTFTHAGVFPYICAIHDTLGMKGEVIVLP
jgi:plastocyanin